MTAAWHLLKLGTYRALLSIALLTAFLCQARFAAAQAAASFTAYATDACAANPWLIPFDQGTAQLSNFAQKRLDELVAAWHVDAGPLLASGRVDGMEDGQYLDLSQMRLRTVTQALVTRGIPPDAIWTRDDGGKHGFTENRPGVSEPQNRIVLITLPRSGEQCAHKIAKTRTDWIRRNCLSSNVEASKAACDDALSHFD